jgi:hypothetical protein
MADIFDLAAERSRRAAEDKPVIAVLTVTYVLDDDGVPMCTASFSVDRKAVPEPEKWILDWIPATAQHLLETARQNSTSTSETEP